MAASSPAGQRRAPIYTPDQLLQLVEAKVFTRDEVRDMVREAMGTTKQSPQQNVQDAKTNTPRRNKPLQKSKPQIAKLKLAPAASPTVKSRKRRSPDFAESDLREVVKNTTRRRFFAECYNQDSRLWVHSKKCDKQYMHRLVFDRAAVDVLDILHTEQPGKLRSFTDDQIKKAMR